MAVDPSDVIRLYSQDGLTMDKVARKLGVSKSRVQQIVKAANVKRQRLFRPASGANNPRPKEQTYRLPALTRELLDRLSETLTVSRTQVVINAVEALARKELGEDAVHTAEEKVRRKPQ